MNKLGAQVVMRTYYCTTYTICVEIVLCLVSSAVYSLKLVAYTTSVEICFAYRAQLQNNFKLLVGEEPQKNWVLWAS